MVNRNMAAARLAGFLSACRAQGIKATHQRLEILRALAGSGAHPDAETLYRQVRRRIPSLSLDTVYRTLRLLEARRVVARVTSQRDRARFDANAERHHHFICTVCGRIGDFICEAFDRIEAPPEAAALGHTETIHVELRGRCRRCRGSSG